MPNNPKQPPETAMATTSSAAPAITPAVVSESDRSQMVVDGKLFAWQKILQNLSDPKLKLENLSTCGYCKSLSFLWGWYTTRGKGDTFEKLIADAAACDLRELKKLIIQIKTIEDQTEEKTQAVDNDPALDTLAKNAAKASIWREAKTRKDQLSDQFYNNPLVQLLNAIQPIQQCRNYFQPSEQGLLDVLKILKDDDQPNLVYEYGCCFVYTKEEYGQLLQAIPNDRMVMFYSENHAVSFYKKDGHWFLFDSMSPTGKIDITPPLFSDPVSLIWACFQYDRSATQAALSFDFYRLTTQDEEPNCYQAIREQMGRLIIAANANRTGRNNLTALWIAAQKGHLDMARALIAAGASIDQVDATNGVTPLWLAAQGGYLDIVKVLIENGANVNFARKASGVTPLFVAVQEGHVAIAEYLISKKAEVTDTIVNLAQTKHPEMATMLVKQKERAVEASAATEAREEAKMTSGFNLKP